MDLLNEEFLLFLSCANQYNLKYLLIGGYAVNYFGYNRNTADMDIWLEPTNENRNLLIEVFQCMGFTKEESEPLLQEDFTSHFVGSVGHAGAEIDLLTFVHKNLSFAEAYSQKEIQEIQTGIKVAIVPYTFLKEMKLLSRREKDLHDIARLEEIRNG